MVILNDEPDWDVAEDWAPMPGLKHTTPSHVTESESEEAPMAGMVVDARRNVVHPDESLTVTDVETDESFCKNNDTEKYGGSIFQGIHSSLLEGNMLDHHPNALTSAEAQHFQDMATFAGTKAIEAGIQLSSMIRYGIDSGISSMRKSLECAEGTVQAHFRENKKTETIQGQRASNASQKPIDSSESRHDILCASSRNPAIRCSRETSELPIFNHIAHSEPTAKPSFEDGATVSTMGDTFAEYIRPMLVKSEWQKHAANNRIIDFDKSLSKHDLPGTRRKSRGDGIDAKVTSKGFSTVESSRGRSTKSTNGAESQSKSRPRRERSKSKSRTRSRSKSISHPERKSMRNQSAPGDELDKVVARQRHSKGKTKKMSTSKARAKSVNTSSSPNAEDKESTSKSMTKMASRLSRFRGRLAS